MRILIIHRSFALVGGAERVIIDKANYLSENGHEVLLVSYEQGEHLFPYQLNSSVSSIDLNCRFFTLSRYSIIIRPFYYYRLKRRFKLSLSETVNRFNPNVIVLASDWQFLIDSVLDVAKEIPVIAEFHNSYDYITKKIGNVDNGLKDKVTKLYYHQFLKYFRRCACLVSLTENDARHWRHHSDNVVVIPNPVVIYPNEINDIPKDNERIICVGRLNGQKRIDRLISAFSLISDKYPTWHIDIFGEGDREQMLQRNIAECKLTDRIIIHAPIKTIYDEYKKSQFLVLSSEYEGRPLVLIEAMSCGIPCVAFDCPSGPKEIINDGISGLLVENGNIEDLAAKMEWMITHDNERLEMGIKAHEEAAMYKPTVIMKEWEKLYTGVSSKTLK